MPCWPRAIAEAGRCLGDFDGMAQAQRPREDTQFLELWAAQAGQCALCGEPMPRHRRAVAHSTLWKEWRPTLDHVRPRSKGGTDALDNLQLVHRRCNRRKGNRWSG
ncbi:MAG: HNH endonuclease [Pseudomonadota bacterium]